MGSTLLGVAVGAFGWGFVAHRARIFPFDILRASAIEMGVLRGPTGLGLEGSRPIIESLASLPYVSTRRSRARPQGGVVVQDRGLLDSGPTLVTRLDAGSRPQAALIDRDGVTVYSWSFDTSVELHHVELLPDGGLVAIDQGRAIFRVDRMGRVLWRTEGAFHHSIEIRSARVLTLRGHVRIVPRVHPRAKVADDEAVWLDLETGREISAISLLDLLLDSTLAYLVPALSDRDLEQMSPGRDASEVTIDLLHANKATEIHRTEAGSLSEGGLLVSLRNLNLLALLDVERRQANWAWGPGRIWKQHDPTLLPNGNLLLFDNGLHASRVLEVEPDSGRVAWRYEADGFYTSFGGGAQRLDNGNTLVTESETGRVLEVSSSGRVVWTWLSAAVDEEGTRQALFRATRRRPVELGFLSTAEASTP